MFSLVHLNQVVENLTNEIHKMENQRTKAKTTVFPPILHKLQHKIDSLVDEIGNIERREKVRKNITTTGMPDFFHKEIETLNKNMKNIESHEEMEAKLIPQLSNTFQEKFKNITKKVEAIETEKKIHANMSTALSPRLQRRISHLVEEINNLKHSRNKSTPPPVFRLPNEVKQNLANLTNEIIALKKRQIPTARQRTSPKIDKLQHQINNLANQITTLKEHVPSMVSKSKTAKIPKRKTTHKPTNFLQNEILKITNEVKELGKSRVNQHVQIPTPPAKLSRRTTSNLNSMLQNQIHNLANEVKKLKKPRAEEQDEQEEHKTKSSPAITNQFQTFVSNITNAIHSLEDQQQIDKRNTTLTTPISNRLQDKISNLSITVEKIANHVMRHQGAISPFNNRLHTQMLNLSKQIEHLEKKQVDKTRAPLTPLSTTAAQTTTTATVSISGKLQHVISNLTQEMKKIERQQEETKLKISKPPPLSIKFEQLFRNISKEIHTWKTKPTIKQLQRTRTHPMSKQFSDAFRNLTAKVGNMEMKQRKMESQSKETLLSDKLQHWFSNITSEMHSLERNQVVSRHTTRKPENKVEVEIYNLTKHLQVMENKARQLHPTRPSLILKKLQEEFVNLTHDVHHFEKQQLNEQPHKRDKLEVTNKLQEEITNLSKGIQRIEEQHMQEVNKTASDPNIPDKIQLIMTNFTKQIHRIEQQRLQIEGRRKTTPPIPRMLQEEIKNLTKSMEHLERQKINSNNKTSQLPIKQSIMQIEISNLTKEITKIERKQLAAQNKPVPVPSLPKRFQQEMNNLTIAMENIERHQLDVERKGNNTPTHSDKMQLEINSVLKEIRDLKKNESSFRNAKPTIRSPKSTQNNTQKSKHKNLAAAFAMKLNFNPAQNEDEESHPTVKTTAKARNITLMPASLPDFNINKNNEHHDPDFSSNLPTETPMVTKVHKSTTTTQYASIDQHKVPHLENDTEREHEEDISLHAEGLTKTSNERSALNIDTFGLLAMIDTAEAKEDHGSSVDDFTFPTANASYVAPTIKGNSGGAEDSVKPQNSRLKDNKTGEIDKHSTLINFQEKLGNSLRDGEKEAPSMEDIQGIQAAREHMKREPTTGFNTSRIQDIHLSPPKYHHILNRTLRIKIENTVGKKAEELRITSSSKDKKDRVPNKPKPLLLVHNGPMRRHPNKLRLHNKVLRAAIAGKFFVTLYLIHNPM